MWLLGIAIMLMLVVGTTLLRMSLLRAVVSGVLAGAAIVLLVNLFSPGACLQESKGWRILTAYSVYCR